ncbi:MAG: hypothetical protein ACN4GM_15745 [Gammaproteobacteria bacterium]
MKKYIKSSLLGISIMLVSVNTLAADFNYTWGQVSYDDVSLDISGLRNIDGDGLTFSGAYEVTPVVYVKGSISMWDMDFGVDVDYLQFGAGYHTPVNNKTDAVFEFSFGDLDIDSTSIDSWTLSAAVRHQIDNKLELDGAIGLTDYDNDDTEVFLAFNALYSFKKDIAGIFKFRTEDNIDIVSFGVRFYF